MCKKYTYLSRVISNFNLTICPNYTYNFCYNITENKKELYQYYLK